MGSPDPRYKSARWLRLRAAILRRDHHRCSIPGCTTDMTLPREAHVDHIHEVKDGGDFWDPSNLRVLCRRHHAAKTLSVAAERGTESGKHATLRRSGSLT